MYRNPLGERSTSVSLVSVSLARGPATLIAAKAEVTSVTWAHAPVPAIHHLNHCSMSSRLPVVVVTK